MRTAGSILLLAFLSSCTSDPDNDEVYENILVPEQKGEWNLEIAWYGLPVEVHSFRGLQVTDAQTAWISGTDGIFMYTTDATNWYIDSIPVVSGMDLRDIEVLNDSTVLVMTAGSPGVILKTTNRGVNWSVVYENTDELVFMDGMDFNSRTGYVYGDPYDGHHFILKTEDWGDTWNRISADDLPQVLEEEYGFAASGTGLVCVDDDYTVVGYGGTQARTFVLLNGLRHTEVNTPMLHSGQGSGIYSMSFADAENGIAVGGNWEFPDCDSSKIYTHDGGLSWHLAQGVQGYRSGSCYINDGVFVSTGTSGTDMSTDWGESWEMISGEGFNAIQFAVGSEPTSAEGNGIKYVGYAVGSHGRIARLTLTLRYT